MEYPTNNDSNVLIDFPESLSAQELQHFNKILTYIQMCNHEQNIDKKVQILRFINSVLPNEIQLRIPSLITDDYVESALYKLEMACKGRIKLKNYFLFALWTCSRQQDWKKCRGNANGHSFGSTYIFNATKKFYLYSFLQGVPSFISNEKVSA